MTGRLRTLSGGVGGRDVRLVQDVLRAVGYDPGDSDGVFGRRTAQAVSAFQRDHGLVDDGVVGKGTWASLAAADAGEPMRRARLIGTLHGAKAGDDVRLAQELLRDAGDDPGEIDGVYGPRTERAVRSFQSKHGLLPDGIIGPTTWAALLPRDQQAPRIVATGLGVFPQPVLAATVLDGRPVALANRDSRLTVVDVATGGARHLLAEGYSDATGVAVAVAEGPDPVVVVGDGNALLRCLRLRTGDTLDWLTMAHYEPAFPLAAAIVAGRIHLAVPVLPRGTRIVSASLTGPSDQRAHLVDERIVAPVAFALGRRPVLAGVDRSGRTGAVAYQFLDDNDDDEGPRVQPIVPRGGNIASMLVGGPPSRPVLVTCSADGVIERWDAADGRQLPGTMAWEAKESHQVAVTQRSVVVVGSNRHLNRFDLDTGEQVAEPVSLAHPDGRVAEIAAVAATGGGDGREDIVALDRDGNLWHWAPERGPTVESEWRQPNPTVTRDYWTTDDALGYRPYARAIARFIEHESTKPPLTIGIKGPWGAGKTSVMRMVQAMLDPPVDIDQTEWRFRKLQLTDTGRRALSRRAKDKAKDKSKDSRPSATSGRQADGERAVEPTTLKTVLDRAATAPSEAVDLSDKEAGADRTEVRRPTVWFNPWMYQTGEQVWAGLAHEIITQVTRRLPTNQRERFWLELNLRRVDREALRRRIHGLVLQRVLAPAAVFLASLVIGAALLAAGIDWATVSLAPGAGAAAVAVRTRRQLLGRDASATVPWLVEGPVGLAGREDLAKEVGSWGGVVADPDYRTRSGFLYFLQADVKHVLDLVATPERPLVVFIDDLDRCSPGVVTQTIEAVNLFLAGQFPNCIFVLALEPAVVAAHIESAHKDLVERLASSGAGAGWSQLGWRFLEKIVQLPLGLPQPAAAVTRDYVLGLFAVAPADAAAPGAMFAHDDGAVAALEQELARLEHEQAKPGLAALPLERAAVETRLREEHGLDREQARVVADEVAIRRFSQAFSDDDEEVRKVIVKEALSLPNRNPREIKRLVNLFRFYALIVNERRMFVQAGSQTEVFAQVARLAALANRWPHLLSAFALPAPRTDRDRHHDDGPRRIVVEDLEEAALAGGHDRWRAALDRHGLADPEGLRAFLRLGPPLADVARELL